MSIFVEKMDLLQSCLDATWSRKYEHYVVKAIFDGNAHIYVRYEIRSDKYVAGVQLRDGLNQYARENPISEIRFSHAKDATKNIANRLMTVLNISAIEAWIDNAKAQLDHEQREQVSKEYVDSVRTGLPFFTIGTRIDLGTYQKLEHFIKWIEANRVSLLEHFKDFKS